MRPSVGRFGVTAFVTDRDGFGTSNLDGWKMDWKRLTAPAWMIMVVAAAGQLIGCASTGGDSRGVSAVMTASKQRAMTPQAVLAELESGNQRFVDGEGTRYNWLEQAERTASGQYPKAIVLSCLDSRVPPEVIFDQGIGDIFVGRVAGNFENQDQLGSMEFGAKVAGAKVIVVMGHSSCGAVKGAIDNAELGNLTATLANIEPAIASVDPGPGGRTSSNTSYVDRVIEANVRQTMRDIMDRSPVLAEMVRAGELGLVGAVYDLETGRVRWLES